MNIDEKYISRCLQLALNGKGYVSPNPMVGAVIVYNNKIIGEGYHREYGKAHAEVNAIKSVKDKFLLKDATLYVSLEPCAHHGKTPPCAQLIIDNQIPRVIVACADPYPAVSGQGIQMLRNAGVDVTVGVLEHKAKMLNKEFFTVQTKNRPYIYLKWAQTRDGFIDKIRDEGQAPTPTPISNSFMCMLVHKKRAETQGIMIGTNTAINDNPSLTTRFWHGKNPVRIIIDRLGRIPFDYNICDGKVKTIVFTEKLHGNNSLRNLTFCQISFNENVLETVLKTLKEHKINSILVEGGAILLQSFIDNELWDEAYVEISDLTFGNGVKSPIINGQLSDEFKWAKSTQIHLSFDNYKIL